MPYKTSCIPYNIVKSWGLLSKPVLILSLPLLQYQRTEACSCPGCLPVPSSKMEYVALRHLVQDHYKGNPAKPSIRSMFLNVASWGRLWRRVSGASGIDRCVYVYMYIHIYIICIHNLDFVYLPMCTYIQNYMCRVRISRGRW